MFQRRNKHTIAQKIREILWPSMGWHRAFRYYRHRLGRMPGTPYYIAAGFSSGVAVSLTPFMGFHFIMGFLLAKMMRASVIASLLGTLVGNPWSFPILWWAEFKLGNYILNGTDHNGVPEALTIGRLFSEPEKLLVPMTVGGVPLAIVSWMISYFVLRGIIKKYKKRRMKMLQRDLIEEFNEDT